jgi:hypothetical protein
MSDASSHRSHLPHSTDTDSANEDYGDQEHSFRHPCLAVFDQQKCLLSDVEGAGGVCDLGPKAPLISARALELVPFEHYTQLGLFGCLQDETGSVAERRLFVNLSR